MEESTSRRVGGYDLARALSVLGMILINYSLVYHGEKGSWFLKMLTRFAEGKAAATFLIVAGAGMAMMSQRARKSGNFYGKKRDTWVLIRRSLFIFVVGIGCAFIWPGDILFYYAAYIPLVIILLWAPPQRIWLLAFLLIVGFVTLFFMFPYEPNTDLEIMDYQGFFSPETFASNLFYNGYHPVLPWACFLLFGFWLGRQKVHKASIRKGVLVPSIMIFVITQIMTTGVHWLEKFKVISPLGELANLFLDNDPVPPLPLFILNAGSAAMILVIFCLYLSEKFEKAAIMRDMIYTGQLWLTVYVGHIIVGIGLPALFDINLRKIETIEFIWIYSLGYFFLSLIFSAIWRRRFKKGPLEGIMRTITRQE